MNSSRDRSCESLAFIVLFILSALSHFWFIMIAIFIGLAAGLVGALVSRVFLQLMTKQFPKPVCRGELQKGGLAARMLRSILGSHRPAPSTIVQVRSQE